jgi:hypothetical protein
MAALTPEQAAAKLAPLAWKQHRDRLLPRLLPQITKQVQRRVPVQTGRLLRSVAYRVERAGERGVIGSSLHYAAPVHARKPFLHEGQDASMSIVDRELETTGDQFFAEVAS